MDQRIKRLARHRNRRRLRAFDAKYDLFNRTEDVRLIEWASALAKAWANGADVEIRRRK